MGGAAGVSVGVFVAVGRGGLGGLDVAVGGGALVAVGHGVLVVVGSDVAIRVGHLAVA